jgi:hypothetical protein
MGTEMKKLAIPILSVLVLMTAVQCGNNAPSTGGGTTGGNNSVVVHTYVGSCDTGATPFGFGAGTSASPYQICSIAHWNSLANPTYAAANFIVVSDLDATGATLLTAAPFSGNLDGQNHTLSNWTGAGVLFQSVSGTIANLNLKNVNLVGSWRLGMVQTVTSAGTISHCSVQGTIYGPYMSGGIAGVNQGKITGCSVNLQISGNDTVGGIAGVNQGQILNSTCTGSVSYANQNTEIVAPDYGMDFGGIAGCNFGGTITGSSSSCHISAIGNSGGLVGELRSGTISSSYSTGQVQGTGNYLGGLVGVSDNGGTALFPAGYNACQLFGAANNTSGGTITNSYSLANVQGVADVGGLIGGNSSTISDSFSAGPVSGSGANIGGLVGSAIAGSVATSYWDTQASGQAASPAGTAETTAAMQTQATYSGFDFTNTWNAPSSGEYPTLR